MFLINYSTDKSIPVMFPLASYFFMLFLVTLSSTSLNFAQHSAQRLVDGEHEITLLNKWAIQFFQSVAQTFFQKYFRKSWLRFYLSNIYKQKVPILLTLEIWRMRKIIEWHSFLKEIHRWANLFSAGQLPCPPPTPIYYKPGIFGDTSDKN